MSQPKIRKKFIILPRPEIAKPEITKPEVAKPEVAKPEVAKPEVAKPVRKKFIILPKIPKVLSFGAEVDQLVTEWYTQRGLSVPPEDLVGAQIDAARAAEEAALEAAWVAFAEEIPAVVPDYGTPEFWAYHRAKKAAENKRREEEGLPPLPTKKELEAEKAKKKADKEAAKAAKEAAKAAKKAKKV